MYVYLTDYNVDIRLLPLRPAFVSRVFRVGFVVDRLSLLRYFCEVLRVSPISNIPSIHHTDPHLNIAATRLACV